MQQNATNDTASCVEVSLEELGDVLIAISVVAKKLANKIYANSESMKGDKPCMNIMD